MTEERPDDLMLPPPPQPPYFDPALQEWVLSRYGDVSAALADPSLSREAVKPYIHSALQPLRPRPLQFRVSSPTINLLSEFAEPWCGALACEFTGADPEDKCLLEIARRVSGAASKEAAEAHQELERRLPSNGIPMAAAAFVALAQTLPAFLACAWLALLRFPSELCRLRGHADLLPLAMEELLRFGGLARVFHRVAAEPTALNGARIEKGQRVALLFRSANRDPEQFPEPNRLDVTRRASGHLAFGSGAHACLAASSIRTAASAATAAFVNCFHSASVREPVLWRDGNGFRAPASLYVVLP